MKITVKCKECGKDMVTGSTMTTRKKYHGECYLKVAKSKGISQLIKIT